MFRFCRGRWAGCRQHLQVHCTIGFLMHLLRNTCVTACFTVFVQNTWIYGCCGNYNWIFWFWCRQKSLHRVTWSRREWGRAVVLVLALEHWAWSGGWCCVPAEARIGLKWFFQKMHIIFCHKQACLPAMQSSVLKCCLLSHFTYRNTAVLEAYSHQEGGLQQDLLLLTVTKDGRTTTGQKHPATFSWKYLFLKNATCWITVQLYTEIWRTWPKDPSQKFLLGNAGWVASGRNAAKFLLFRKMFSEPQG